MFPLNILLLRLHRPLFSILSLLFFLLSHARASATLLRNSPYENCVVDQDCRVADGNASCLYGQCICSNTSFPGKWCAPASTIPYEYYEVFTFTEHHEDDRSSRTCSNFLDDPGAMNTLNEILKQGKTFQFLDSEALCTRKFRTTYISKIRATSPDLAHEEINSLLTIAKKKVYSIEKTILKGRAVLARHLSCSVYNAVRSVTIDEVCFPTCVTGYDRILLDTSPVRRYECKAPANEISSMWKALIAIAGVSFAVIVAIITFLIVKKRFEPTDEELYLQDDEFPNDLDTEMSDKTTSFDETRLSGLTKSGNSKTGGSISDSRTVDGDADLTKITTEKE